MKRSEIMKTTVDNLKKALGITDIPLATMLGVSERSLNDWKDRPKDKLPPKAFRLQRLADVVDYIKSEFSFLQSGQILGVLESGRVIIDPTDEDDGTITLMNFINAHHRDAAYVAQVREAVLDYCEEEGIRTPLDEVNQPVQFVR